MLPTSKSAKQLPVGTGVLFIGGYSVGGDWVIWSQRCIELSKAVPGAFYLWLDSGDVNNACQATLCNIWQ